MTPKGISMGTVFWSNSAVRSQEHMPPMSDNLSHSRKRNMIFNMIIFKMRGASWTLYFRATSPSKQGCMTCLHRREGTQEESLAFMITETEAPESLRRLWFCSVLVKEFALASVWKADCSGPVRGCWNNPGEERWWLTSVAMTVIGSMIWKTKLLRFCPWVRYDSERERERRQVWLQSSWPKQPAE